MLLQCAMILHFMFFALILTPVASAKILAIAAAVYAVLQVAKKVFPSIGGGWALALNIGLSVLGFLVTVPVANLLSIDTLTGLIMAVAASAGIHGTVKSMTAPAS
jgi:hypothetical protein